MELIRDRQKLGRARKSLQPQTFHIMICSTSSVKGKIQSTVAGIKL